jgi:ribonuclease HII
VDPATWKALPKSEKNRLTKLTKPEAHAWLQGYRCVAGVDEAGRGPLAGPVFAAACMIPQGVFFPGINDSKLLSPEKRHQLFLQIKAHPEVRYGIGRVDHEMIDQINIYQASLEAMRRAIAQLSTPPDYILVDGVNLPLPGIISQRVVHGDRLSQMIAAASIIAKETRDQIMLEYHALYPVYGFDAHKGYGTEQHRAALAEHGPCPIHRRSFNVPAFALNI